VRPQWMSANTIRLLDTCAALRRNPQHSRQRARVLTRQIKASLRVDRHRRAEEAALAIGQCLDTEDGAVPDLQGAWDIAKRWYRHASARPHKPSRENLIGTSTTFQALYTAEQPSPPGLPIPVSVAPFAIPDGPPTEDEIRDAVKRMRRRRATGQTGMRAEDFQQWALEAFPDNENAPNRARWDKLVAILTRMWETGEIPTELTWTILVLVPKGNGDSRGIGLLESLQKLSDTIMDTRLKASIRFHEMLHAGFRAERGTGTAILEAKLFQELASAEQQALFMVFIDLRKAYDSLDRTRALHTFEGYGMGPNMLRLIRNFWDRQQVVTRQQGYHGPAFPAG
jgi:Reverse transcriptase (RNA-dependent DNA polymerase)